MSFFCPGYPPVILTFVARPIFKVYRGLMTAVNRRFFRVGILFATCVTLMYVSLFALVRSERFREWLALEVANKTSYKIDLGDLRLIPPFRFVASAVTASKPAGTRLQGERIVLTLSPFDLFSRTIHRLELQKPVLQIALHDLFDSSLQSSFDIAIRHLNIQDGTVVLKLGGGNDLDFRSVSVNAENVSLGQTTGLNLRADLPWLQGTAEMAITSHDTEKEATIRIQQPSTKGLARLVKAKRGPPEAFEADIKLSIKQDRSIRVTASGQSNGMNIGANKITARFDSRADLNPNLREADLAARIVATELTSQVRLLPVVIPKGGATLGVEGKYSIADQQLRLKSFDLESSLGNATGRGQVSFTPQIHFSNTQVNLRKVSLEHLKPLFTDSLNLLTARGLMEADLELQGPWRSVAIKGIARGSGVQLRGEQFSLAELNIKTLVEWADPSFRATDVQISGKKLAFSQKDRTQISAEEIRIDGTLETKANEPVRSAGKVRILQGRFATPDGSKVGENLALGGRFETTTDRDKGVTSLAGKLDIEQGEMLWTRFFGDLKSQRPTLDFDGDYVPSADSIRLRHLNLTLASVGHVAIAGDIEQISKTPAARLEVKSDGIQPGGFFEFFIRETLNRSYPVLDQLALGGRISFSAKANGTLDDLAVEGDLQLREGEVRTKSNKWQVGPMHVRLPFRVRYPAAATEPAVREVPTGMLVIESARFGAESIPTTKTAVSLWNNSLRFHQPVLIPIYGGSVGISNLALKDIMKDPQEAVLSVEARNLQLQKLTEALGWYRFGGTLSGSIPKIEWASSSLRTQGQIQIDVFGGHVQISKMEVENPFFSVPSIKLDARFHDIQLEQASDTFEFGRISGILEGVIDNLIITAGQPSQLRADIHTVDRRGTSQWINVEALNKLTVLSSGDDASAAYGGLATFFENFRYSKMGFTATLRNDKLTLRGIESKDGKEFLIVGSLLPPTVNIISHTQEIGFSELLTRLERVKKSAKPEIK